MVCSCKIKKTTHNFNQVLKFEKCKLTTKRYDNVLTKYSNKIHTDPITIINSKCKQSPKTEITNKTTFTQINIQLNITHPNSKKGHPRISKKQILEMFCS